MALTDYIQHEGEVVTLRAYKDPDEKWASYWDLHLNGTLVSVEVNELDDYIKFFKKLKKKSEDK